MTINVVKPKAGQEEIIQALQAIIDLLRENRNVRAKYSLKVALEELT